jgi:FAD-linked sulfhydryl oxidase
LGVSTWALLHSVAAIYSNNPNKTEMESLKDFFDGLMYFYPSKSELMKEILKEHPLEYSNREELIYYMCEIHNILNRKLGKKKFSCKDAFNVWGGDCGCDE